jgi:uncharacterized RDD family membrane protein YckC
MLPETSAAQTEQHLFTEEDLNHYEEASRGRRFLNFLLDGLVMGIALSWIVEYLVDIFLASFFPDFLRAVYFKGPEYYLHDLMVNCLLIFLYYTICETLFRGYTLGKLVTGTRAIRENGGELSFKDALLRSLCRLVPIEPLSGFGYRPWHDSWTRTIVIKTR